MRLLRSDLRCVSISLALATLAFVGGCSDDDKETTPPPNQAPVVTSVTVSPSTVQTGQTATVTVVATDPDDTALTYSYQVSGGTISGTTQIATWTAPGTAGSYTVTVTVRDPDNAVGTGFGTLNVTAPQQQTGFFGTASLAVGQSGDLSNSRAAYYDDLTDWANDLPAGYQAVSGFGASVTFNFQNVPPGSYYFDCWKDMDNNGFIDAGDFFGWYGSGVYPNGTLTPYNVVQGQMTNLNVVTIYAF